MHNTNKNRKVTESSNKATALLPYFNKNTC